MSSNLLIKIAEAFEQSVKPFEQLNERFSNIGTSLVPTKNPEARVELVDGFWLDYRVNSDVETTVQQGENNQGIRFVLESRGSSPWYSLSYMLPVGELLNGRFLGLLTTAHSVGPARFRFSLRVMRQDDFVDHFSKQLVVLNGDRSEDLMFCKLDEDMFAGAVGAEVLIFFEGNHFDVTLESLETLLI